MINKLQIAIIEKFKKHGYDLSEIGCSEHAYKFDDILAIIKFVKDSNGIILGGGHLIKII